MGLRVSEVWSLGSAGEEGGDDDLYRVRRQVGSRIVGCVGTSVRARVKVHFYSCR